MIGRDINGRMIHKNDIIIIHHWDLPIGFYSPNPYDLIGELGIVSGPCHQKGWIEIEEIYGTIPSWNSNCANTDYFQCCDVEVI
jgi:hypothetical protein